MMNKNIILSFILMLYLNKSSCTSESNTVFSMDSKSSNVPTNNYSEFQQGLLHQIRIYMDGIAMERKNILRKKQNIKSSKEGKRCNWKFCQLFQKEDIVRIKPVSNQERILLSLVHPFQRVSFIN